MSAQTEDAALLAGAVATADPAVLADPQPATAAMTEDAATDAALPGRLPVTGAADAANADSAQVSDAAVDHPAQETASVQTEAAQART